MPKAITAKDYLGPESYEWDRINKTLRCTGKDRQSLRKCRFLWENLRKKRC